MELTIAVSGQVAVGENPAFSHMSDNGIWGFRVADGALEAGRIEPAPGDIDWASLSWPDFALAIYEENISLLRLKHVPRLGLYGAWHQGPVYEGGELISSERHRFAVWTGGFDPSDCLVDGEMRLSMDSPVAQISLILENPRQSLVGEEKSLFHPGAEMSLSFSAGDSDPYPMGVFFVDRASTRIPSALCRVDGRNMTGKILHDQTFDEANTFAPKALDLTFCDVLEAAGLSAGEYLVQPGAVFDVGMEFPASMSFLDGISELLKTSLNWVIQERMDGKIVVGSTVTYSELPQNSRYIFQRNQEVFSREIERDDLHSYSRVCVTSLVTDPETEEQEVMSVYEDVVLSDSNWSIPPNKTLYVSVADETSGAELSTLAGDLAGRIASAGTLETFVGPFRPHLLVGDEAEIVSASGQSLLGVITSLTHRFGKSGYYTEFTVDSAGESGKPRIRDFVERISKGAVIPTRAKRIY